MKHATLVIMAAGVGSRFGGGIKQLESVGPCGEIIMDYSIYDALEAGFNKVVFVIRKEIEKDFKEIIGNRVEEIVKVDYVYQEVDDIPEQYRNKYKTRNKPWGTGQAILCCKEVIEEPFIVINADDYYGKTAFVRAYKYLTEEHKSEDKINICMIGFMLKNTLSDNGGVTRGICSVGKNKLLNDIVETHNIVKTGDLITADKDGERLVIEQESIVSMNMWGFTPEFFEILEKEFTYFLDKLDSNDIKSEYLLPTIIGDQLKKKNVEVKVLQSSDEWFGVTYKEDKKSVTEAINQLVLEGVYPHKLYK